MESKKLKLKVHHRNFSGEPIASRCVGAKTSVKHNTATVFIHLVCCVQPRI